jgi:hypothetical protein
MIAANNGHLLAFDNLSGLPAWLSDALCRLGSGGSFAVRQLYTDDEEVLFKAARPTLLNGIEDIIGRQRLRRPGRLLPIAGGRPRAAAQFFVFPVGYLQGYVNLTLRGICRGEPSRRLEYLGHIGDLAGCAHAERTDAKAADHEIARPLLGSGSDQKTVCTALEWEQKGLVCGLSVAPP